MASTTTLTYSQDTYVLTVVDARAAVQVNVITAPKGDPGDPGPAGENAEIVICANLAEYLALPVETQEDGRWYVVPKTS